MAKKKPKKATKQENSKPVFASKAKGKKKSMTKKSTTKKKAVKKTSAKKATATSVDTILKSFEKERVTKNSDLVATRKKLDQVTKKIASLKVELLELQAKEGETEIAIATLDDRRDKEIGKLLSDMGINLDNAASAAKKSSAADQGTPLFPDEESAQEDTSESSEPAAAV